MFANCAPHFHASKILSWNYWLSVSKNYVIARSSITWFTSHIRYLVGPRVLFCLFFLLLFFFFSIITWNVIRMFFSHTILPTPAWNNQLGAMLFWFDFAFAFFFLVHGLVLSRVAQFFCFYLFLCCNFYELDFFGLKWFWWLAWMNEWMTKRLN